MKTCTICKIEKPLKDFYNGVRKCKSCYKEIRKGKYLEKRKQYYIKNKQKLVSQIMDWNKKRYKTDSNFKLKGNIRTLIRESFKRGVNGKYKKAEKTEAILGCDMEKFMQHLQSQFQPGMTFENHGRGKGKWSIDHIIPISLAKNEKEIYKLNHYTNLQPLWWDENLRKGNKVIY